MKLYEALAQAFADEGTSTVFGLMGDANMFWMNALDKLGVRLVDARHEGVALAMADGYAQISGGPAVCTTTSGPGVTQLATSLVVAARARTPLVVFCGDTNVGDRGAVQRFDHEAFAAATESGHVRISTVEGAYEGVALAFYRARVESRPIILSCAQDLQQQDFDDGFGAGDYTPSARLWNPAPAYPSPESLAAAADIVVGARRPVIIAGRGARGAADEIRALAERTGALIATTLLTKNFLADDEFQAGISGLFTTRPVIELFTECDCVIAVGASMNHYTTEHGYLFPEARYVQIDTAAQAYLGDGRRADAYLQADAAVGVRLLTESLTAPNVGYRTPEVRARLDRMLDDPREYDIPAGTVDPRAAYRALDAALPADVGLVLGSGHQSHFATVLMTRPRPMTLVNKHFGCIGQGLGTSIGALIAAGGRPTALVEGDSSLMMHIGDFETAVRHDLPLLVVVFNDESLGAEYHKSMVKGLRPELARVPTANLGAVATAFGGRGWLVRSEDELRAAVAAFAADPGPAIIDVRTAPTVLSIQYRRLWQGDPDA